MIKFGLQTSLKCKHFQSSTMGSGIFSQWLTCFQNMVGCIRSKTKLENLLQTRSRRFQKIKAKTTKALDRQRLRVLQQTCEGVRCRALLYWKWGEIVSGRTFRTMKEKMFKYFTANNTNKYIDVLEDFVEKYNNTRHSSIKMTPVEVRKKTNAVTVYRNFYPDLTSRPMRAKFKIGDKFRIQKKKGFFEKGFTPNWIEEVFTVSKVQRTDPITYKITDYNNEEVQGTFYEKELQKTSQEVFRIERLWKKAKRNHWWNGKAIQKVSILGWTTKNLLKFNIKCQMKNKVLESKAQQSLCLWTTSSHQSNVKNCKKLWTLIQSCIEKYSSIEVNLDQVQMPKTKLDPIQNLKI